MKFGVYVTMVFLATWKFMFTPLVAYAAGLNFLETFTSVLIGAYLAASIFYFGSNYFIRRAIQRRIKRAAEAAKKGRIFFPKKRITKTNRRIIYFKQRVNKYFVFWAFPLFLSIPGGCILVAKFYKHYPQTFPFIIFFLTLDCLFITAGVFCIRNMTI